jgi:hypothetical protein
VGVGRGGSWSKLESRAKPGWPTTKTRRWRLARLERSTIFPSSLLNVYTHCYKPSDISRLRKQVTANPQRLPKAGDESPGCIPSSSTTSLLANSSNRAGFRRRGRIPKNGNQFAPTVCDSSNERSAASV